MVKISVAMACYNHEKFVGQAIESVLTQEGCDLELVVVDDGSADQSTDEIRKFNDPRLKVVALEKNQGACLALKKAIELGKGDYVAIMNSDDRFLPGKLKKQAHFLDQNPDVYAVFGLPQFINSKGEVLRKTEHFGKSLLQQPNRGRHDWLRHFFYQGNALCHPTVLIRRACYQNLGYYNPCFAQLPDFDFWIRVALNYNIHVFNEELTQFRILEDGSNASAAKLENYWQNQWETTQILHSFSSISSLKDYLMIFPEDQSLYSSFSEEDASYLIPYAIAMKALLSKQIHPIHQPAYQSFGLQVLYDLLQRADLSVKLKELLNFSPAQFTRLTKSHEIFNPVGNWDRTFIERFPPHKKLLASFKSKLKSVLKTVGARR